MINEGVILSDTSIMMKSEMIRQIRKLGPTTPDEWERAVFRSLTGGSRDDLDWEFDDNHAGYHLWILTFDRLIEELIDDGYVTERESVDGTRMLVPTETDPGLAVSRLAYPGRA